MTQERGSPGNRTLNLRIKRPKGLDPLISDFACYPRLEDRIELPDNHVESRLFPSVYLVVAW
jgi:hypothetical protein